MHVEQWMCKNASITIAMSVHLPGSLSLSLFICPYLMAWELPSGCSWNLILEIFTKMFNKLKNFGWDRTIVSSHMWQWPWNHVGNPELDERHWMPCPCKGHRPQTTLMLLTLLTKVKGMFLQMKQPLITSYKTAFMNRSSSQQDNKSSTIITLVYISRLLIPKHISV